MARRRNKKTGNNSRGKADSSSPVARKQISAEKEISEKIKAEQKTEQKTAVNVSASKNKGRITVATCLAGMFLSLILGVYLGTLVPEILQEKKIQEIETVEQRLPSVNKEAPVQDNQTENIPVNLSRTITELEATLQKNPDSAKDWASLGDLYFDTGQAQKAVHAYEHSLKINPENADVLTDLGIMHRELHEFDKAVQCFREAVKINPRHVNALFNEGVVLAYDLHDKAAAIQAWQKLISINPEARSPSGAPVTTMIEELR